MLGRTSLNILQIIIAFLLLIPFTQCAIPKSRSQFFDSNNKKLNNMLQNSLKKHFLDNPTCDISQAYAEFAKHGNTHTLQCNSNNQNQGDVNTFTVTGSSTSNRINIDFTDYTSKQLTIILDNLNLQSRHPMQVSQGGTLTIKIKGSNVIQSTTGGADINSNQNFYAGIYCSKSNIIFQAYDSSENNKLEVTGVKGNPGIGTLDECYQLRFESGYVKATGSGEYKLFDDNGNVKTLTWIDNYEANTQHEEQIQWACGAGIGTGFYGTVDLIKITGGTVEAIAGASRAAGIGSGPCGRTGEILITGGHVIASGSEQGAAIGAGSGKQDSEGYVTTLTISGGTVEAYAQEYGKGAAIGGGCGERKNSAYVGTLTISGGSITAKGSEHAAGIGTGFSQWNEQEANNAGIIKDYFYIKNTNNLHFCATSFHENNALGKNPKNKVGEKVYNHFSSEVDFLSSSYDGHRTYFGNYYPSAFISECPSYVPPATEFVPTEFVPTEFVPTEFVPTEFVPTEFVPTEFVPTEFVPTEFVPTEFVPTEFVPTEFVPTEFVPTEFVPTEFVPTEFVPTPFQPTAEPEPVVTPKKDSNDEDPNAQKNLDAPSGSDSSDQKSIPWMIIAIAAGALVLAALITLLILKLRKGEKMQPETMSYVSNDSSAIITQDNPLYKDGNDSDDPFKNDFEENDDTFINTTATQI